MNTQIRHVAYSLIGISIVLTVLLAYPEVIRSRASARATTSTTSLVPGIVSMADEGTVTLKTSPTDIKTWTLRNHAYPSNTTYWPCSASSRETGSSAPNVNEVFAGYDHF